MRYHYTQGRRSVLAIPILCHLEGGPFSLKRSIHDHVGMVSVSPPGGDISSGGRVLAVGY